jgi:signal transduction histidine kinase
MRPDKHRLGSVGVLIATGCLIALTWAGTLRAIEAQRIEASARVTATITNQAITFSEQINRQILALDQSLRIVGDMWAMNPKGFDLESWRDRSVVLSGISRDMLLMDQNGIVRQSTVPEAVNQDLSGRDFFRDPAAHPVAGGGSFVGGTTIGPILRQWHMNVARPLQRTDGTFGGVIDADYRISALTDIFSQTDIGSHGLIALVGLNDGKLRAAVGPATIDPDARIADTPMFLALRRDPNAIWVGSSPSDAVIRIHAFRRLPDRDLAIVVAADEQEAMRPATVWAFQARAFAACITALLIAMAGLLLRARRAAKKRVAALAEGQAVLAAANAQLEVARAEATAKTEQLEVTLAGMADGVSMLDAHLCLVEWNARFPEIAGIPGDILRVGQPMEQILRAQAIAGQFGDVNVEAEIERRMATLRAGRAGTTERATPDGRFLQLRRNRLPDGGFVTLYSDITEHKLAEQALQAARAAADTANAAKSRFVAIVSHEIRTPLNALLNTMRLLADSDLATTQRSLVDMARQSGDALYGLINDILEMSRMEAGQLTLRPSRFALRPVLASATGMFQAQAQQRGIGFRIDIADDVPEELLTDPGRVRQILLNLLSNAVNGSAEGGQGPFRIFGYGGSANIGTRRRAGDFRRGPQAPVPPVHPPGTSGG